MKRRFSITEREGYLILSTLTLAERELKQADEDLGLTAREYMILTEIKELKHKLANYNWEK